MLAQRRMRALGLVESMGATDRNVRLVLEANGVIVGVVGAVLGFALGLVAWLAYRPHNQQSAHHLIAMFALPWNVIAPSMVLAIIATFFAASYPARAITRVPVVSALAGPPAPPRQIHRSLVPGVVALAIGFVFFSLSGASGGGGGVKWLIPGFVALIVGIILVSPFFLALLARVSGKSPIAVRLPLRDMARYRARSGSALSAISLGVMIAVIICAVAVARYANVFDYVGPNMAANELNVYSPNSEGIPFGVGPGAKGANSAVPATPSIESQEATVHAIASAVGATADVELENPAINLQNPSGNGRQWNGADLCRDSVAAPGLWHQPEFHSVQRGRPHVTARTLRFGGRAHLRQRKGLGRDATAVVDWAPVKATRTHARPARASPIRSSRRTACCLRAPRRPTQSSPKVRSTGFTSRARAVSVVGLCKPTERSRRRRSPNAQSLAASNSLSVESKNDEPTSAEIVNWATVFGVAPPLGILAMSVGLIRSETASELRTLTAAGASSRTRRTPDGGDRRWPRLPWGAARDDCGLRRPGRMVPFELIGGRPVRHHQSRTVEQPVPHRDRSARGRHHHRLGAGGAGPNGDLRHDRWSSENTGAFRHPCRVNRRRTTHRLWADDPIVCGDSPRLPCRHLMTQAFGGIPMSSGPMCPTVTQAAAPPTLSE